MHYWGLGIGDWGLGMGDWGLGIGRNPQSPIPNPQLFKYCLTFLMVISYIIMNRFLKNTKFF